MRAIPVRQLYVLGAVLLWAVVLALGLEVHARFFSIQAQLHAPTEQTAQAPGSLSGLSSEDVQSYADTFCLLSDTDKDASAAGRGWICSIVDGNGIFSELHGDRQGLVFTLLNNELSGKSITEVANELMASQILTEIRYALRFSRPTYYSHGGPDLQMHGWYVPVHCKTRRPESCLLIQAEMPSTLPDDKKPSFFTRWEVPFFKLKRDTAVSDGFHTNRYGFRDDDVVVPKPPGVFRIVCVGGSTTEEGRTNETTYPKYLQRRLREYCGTDAIEVLNCGISAIGSQKELLRIEDYLTFQPDLLIEYNGVNDLSRPLLVRWLFHAPLWQRLLRESRFVKEHFPLLFLPSAEQMAQDTEDAIIANLKAIRMAAKQRGADVAFCSFAYPAASTATTEERVRLENNVKNVWVGPNGSFRAYLAAVQVYNALVKGMCAETGARYIAVAESQQWPAARFNDICHMTDEGIQQKANVIFEQLKDSVKRAVVSKEGIAAPRAGRANLVP